MSEAGKGVVDVSVCVGKGRSSLRAGGDGFI